jgi:hypothetical protein
MDCRPVAIVLALLLSSAAFAQQSNTAAVPEPTVLVGSSVYSSDAQEVGRVTGVDVGADGKPTSLQAEISGFLGLGSSSVHLGSNEFTQKGDRIVLSKTANQVRGIPDESYHSFDPSRTGPGPASPSP